MRAYTNELNGEKVLLNPNSVWYSADEERLLGYRDVTIYMHYSAYKQMSIKFIRRCAYRNIHIIIVY